MRDLIRSEWRRFRLITAIVTGCHLLVLVTMSRALDLPQLGSDEQGAMLVVYMFIGLTLALLQIGSYRQSSRWLWLIHRPLPPVRIFAALALSALAVLSITIFTPLLVYLVLTDVFTSHVIDSRHYVTVVHALSFTMMAWFAGCHAFTTRHRSAIALLIVPMVFAWHLASVWWLLLPVAGCLWWMTSVARHSFRADRFGRVAVNHALLLTALPLQLAFFLLAFHVGKGALDFTTLLVRSPGRAVLSSDPTVDADAAMRTFTQTFIAQGLERSLDTRAASWREQLPLLPVASVTPDIERFPVRHQFSNVGRPWWDEARNIKYTFSHDRMRFHGRDSRTGASRGWWGIHGIVDSLPYADVPDGRMTRSVLYSTDPQAQQQHEVIHLPDGEWFVGRPVEGLDRIMVLTNRRILAYRRDRDALSEATPPDLDWQLSLTAGEFAPVVDIAEVLDGWLVSLFYFDTRELSGFESLQSTWQQVVYVDANGAATAVGERHDIQDHSASFGFSESAPVASWWLSPALYAFAHVPDVLNTGLTQPPRFHVVPKAPLFWVLAMTLLLISSAAAHVWLRQLPVSTLRRRFWLLNCALIGLPAFLSMVCLEPRGGTER